MHAPARRRLVRDLLVRAVAASPSVRVEFARQARDHLIALGATARSPKRVEEYAGQADTLAALLRPSGAPRRTVSTVPPAMVSTRRTIRVEPPCDDTDRGWWTRDTQPVPVPLPPVAVEPPRPPPPARRRVAVVVGPVKR